MNLFDKKWRLICRLKAPGEDEFLAYYANNYRFRWIAVFDAWYQRLQNRGSGWDIMTQIDNLPR